MHKKIKGIFHFLNFLFIGVLSILMLIDRIVIRDDYTIHYFLPFIIATGIIYLIAYIIYHISLHKKDLITLNLKKGLDSIVAENIMLLIFVIFFKADIAATAIYISVTPLITSTAAGILGGIFLFTEKDHAVLKELPLVDLYYLSGRGATLFPAIQTFLTIALLIFINTMGIWKTYGESSFNGYYLLVPFSITFITMLRRKNTAEYFTRSVYSTISNTACIIMLFFILKFMAGRVGVYESFLIGSMLCIKIILDIFINSFVLNKFERLNQTLGSKQAKRRL